MGAARASALLSAACLGVAVEAWAEPPAASAPVSEPSADEVRVELVSSDPLAVLERRPSELSKRGDLAGVDGWQAVCIAPCRATLSRQDGLRVGGSGVDPLYFYLPEEPGPYTVHAETGSAASESAGLALVLAGASTLLIGVMSTVVLASGPLKNAEPDSAPTILFHASITGIIIGGTVMLIGVPLRFAAMGEVRVERKSTAPAPPPRAELGAGLYLTPTGLAF